MFTSVSNLRKQQNKKIEYYIDENEKNKAIQYKSGFCNNFFKLMNKNIKTTAIALATVNISLGVFYAVFEWYWILAWFIYLGSNIFLYVALEICKNNKKQKDNGKMPFDDESDSEKEFSLSKADSTQQLKPDPKKESIKMQPFRYTDSNFNNSSKNYREFHYKNSECSTRAEKNKIDKLSYSPRINVSFIGDNDFNPEINYVIAKKAALREKIESLTASPISSAGILNHNDVNTRSYAENKKY